MTPSRASYTIGAPIEVQPAVGGGVRSRGLMPGMQREIIHVGDWPPDDDNPVFPVGSQPKELLRCREELISSEVIAGHRYIFKQPAGWQAYQIWSEIIAYQVSLMVDVPVPKSYLAQAADGGVGVLVEMFYGYPRQDHQERFVHGADLLQRTIRDKKTGRPHGVGTNVRLCQRYGVADAAIAWGRYLAFDALIGNTDRHPDNWGLVWAYRTGSLPAVRLAPAFDNGTSLGHEIREEALAKPWTASRLDRYIMRGRHHCGWSPADDSRAQHIALCRRYLGAYPVAADAMKAVARGESRRYEDMLDGCVALGGPLPFSVARARLVAALLRRRQALLAEALGA